MRAVDPVAFLGRGVSAGLRLGRGTADRAVRLVGPHVAKVADLVGSRGRHEAPTTTTTFTPSKPGGDSPAARPTGPSPASVASNIAPQRPTVKPVKPPVRAKSVPGAKLPPPRPSAT